MKSFTKKKHEDNLKNLELRKQFINLLEKLVDNNTREIGYKGLKELIYNNSYSYDALRIYLNSLMNFQTQNLKAKEIIILLYGYIGQIYKNNLLDPIDHPISLINSINRIITHIRNSKMKTSAYTLLKACSYSILEILDNCMPKNDINNLNKIFIEPFMHNINISSNTYIKNGCCVYINDLIYHIQNGNEFDLKILNCILYKNKFINEIILKIKIDFYQNYFLYEALYNLILYFNFDYIKNSYINIIYKMIEILENKNILKNETKISCLKVLYILLKKIKENNFDYNNLKNILCDIRNSIGNYIDDRMKGVRKVARDSVKLLNLIEFEQKSEGENSDKINHKNIFQKMRNLSKQGKVQEFSHYDNMIVDNLHKDIYKKGMGNLLNLSNFIQKHTKSNIKENININKKFLKSNNVQRFNYFNKVPINEDFFKQQENNNGLFLKENLHINNNTQKNLFSEENNFIEPTNLANTSKSKSEYNYLPNINEKYNPNYNNYNNNINYEKNYNDIDNNQNDKIDKIDNNKKLEVDPTLYYSNNINEVYNCLNNSKKKFLEFEKKINIKLYNNENKLIQIKNSLEENNENIIKYYNNILDDTIKSEYTKTDNEFSIDNNSLLKTSEFNIEGKEYFRVYLKALNLYNNQNYNDAFSLIIDDEIYLLRLLFLAKPKLDYICSLLNKDLCLKIMLKINHICHSHFLMKIQRIIKNGINKNNQNMN